MNDEKRKGVMARDTIVFMRRPELEERLEVTVEEKVFFSDNGSTSVDVAIKMSLQYYFNQGQKY